MSYFNKNRVLLWIVVAVLIINLTATVTIIYKMQHPPKRDFHKNERPCAQAYLENELHLTPGQNEEFKRLKKAHHDSVFVLHKMMKEKRAIISENMVKPEPDTTLLYNTTEELGMLFAQTRKLYISHYFELRKVCNPEQQEKLAKIYTRVFCGEDGCQMPPNNKCEKEKNSPKHCRPQHFED